MTSATPTMALGDIASSGVASPGQGPAINSLMGPPSDQAVVPPTAQQQAKDSTRQATEQVQQLADMAQAIASKYPEFAEAAKAIADACKAGQTKLVANMLRGLEGPPPPTAAM